ncbi:MAG: hypothetical protein R2991_06060 [Thermoanaerobaculia bacterium]
MANGIEDAQPPHGGMDPAPDDERTDDANAGDSNEPEGEDETDDP